MLLAIDGALNAGLLAAQIIPLFSPELKSKLSNYKNSLNSKVKDKDNNLRELGVNEYLNRFQRSN